MTSEELAATRSMKHQINMHETSKCSWYVKPSVKAETLVSGVDTFSAGFQDYSICHPMLPGQKGFPKFQLIILHFPKGALCSSINS